MRTKFELNSETYSDDAGRSVPLTVTISVQCRDRDGADAEYEVEYIQHPDRPLDVITESDLCEADQARLDRLAQAAADNAAPDAAQEYLESAADAAYEAWKDRDL